MAKHSMTLAVGGQYTGCHCASSYTDHTTQLYARPLLALTVWQCVSMLISSGSDDVVAQILHHRCCHAEQDH
ncbi:hypothetical protein DPX16_19425 [Anabarilius grahami]|uniref:Uncharacterized protein n=1 Tax=Anabarilius grahami TaxID=495550 RepID=A0A3N0Z035_ANAGA|nr:hypothetical protein DPX16_19425 [Anabarilius grahami]